MFSARLVEAEHIERPLVHFLQKNRSERSVTEIQGDVEVLPVEGGVETKLRGRRKSAKTAKKKISFSSDQLSDL